MFYCFSYSKKLLTDTFFTNIFAQRVHFPAVLPASVTSSLAAGSRFPLGCFSLSTLQLIHCVIAIAHFFHSFCPAPRQFRFLKGFLKGVLPSVSLDPGGDCITILKLPSPETQQNNFNLIRIRFGM